MPTVVQLIASENRLKPRNTKNHATVDGTRRRGFVSQSEMTCSNRPPAAATGTYLSAFAAGRYISSTPVTTRPVTSTNQSVASELEINANAIIVPTAQATQSIVACAAKPPAAMAKNSARPTSTMRSTLDVRVVLIDMMQLRLGDRCFLHGPC